MKKVTEEVLHAVEYPWLGLACRGKDDRHCIELPNEKKRDLTSGYILEAPYPVDTKICALNTYLPYNTTNFLPEISLWFQDIFG